jgi:hypothetical protein
MKRSRPKLGFRNKTAAQELSICGNFIRAVAKVPAEKRPHVRVDELNTRLADTTAAANLVESLRVQLRTAVSARNAQLAKLCHGVTYGVVGYSVTNRDDAEFLRAGVRLSKARLPVGQPGAPTQFRGAPGAHEGTVQLRFKRPLRRCSFAIQYAVEETPTDWVRGFGLCVTNPLIENLVPGARYWFRVAAFNSYGQGPWSQPILVRAA